MKNEPCVRFGMRRSPKISENPADSRKRRPPSVMLLTASTNQRFTLGDPGDQLLSGGKSREYTGCDRNHFSSYVQNWLTFG